MQIPLGLYRCDVTWGSRKKELGEGTWENRVPLGSRGRWWFMTDKVRKDSLPCLGAQTTLQERLEREELGHLLHLERTGTSSILSPASVTCHQPTPTLPSYPRTLRTVRPGLSEPPLPPLQKKRRRGLFHFRRPRSFKGDRGPGSPTAGLLLPPPPPPPPTQESPPSPDPPSLGNNSSPCWSPEEESSLLPGFGGARGSALGRKMVSGAREPRSPFLLAYTWPTP